MSPLQAEAAGSSASETLMQLKGAGSTGCLTVDSTDGQVGRIYILFGKPYHATTGQASGSAALDEILQWPSATVAFDAQAALPAEQTIGPLDTSADHRVAVWTVRLVLFLVFFVVPLSAVGLAIWSILHSLGPESATATQYAAAPQCSLGASAQDCYVLERGMLVSQSWTYGRFGARTDTLVVSLPDGAHTVSLYFDVFGPRDIPYASSDGQVSVKVYQGHITEVFAADGSSFETSESPATAPQRGKGVQVVVIMFCGVWLLVVLYLFMGSSRAVQRAWTAITMPVRRLLK